MICFKECKTKARFSQLNTSADDHLNLFPGTLFSSRCAEIRRYSESRHITDRLGVKRGKRVPCTLANFLVFTNPLYYCLLLRHALTISWLKLVPCCDNL